MYGWDIQRLVLVQLPYNMGIWYCVDYMVTIYDDEVRVHILPYHQRLPQLVIFNIL
ncbi:hypothetical protein Lalb_Chr10g0103431 [Lupinus albus]|uniref:Uncharacterized protein n=1 Tax=Lupinus albus TaxID=3870 RepID=A0A6A4PXK1_LUPAL|nr:hypothetical protein Lalb_Chr10g0103431 [Lupinus albus]